MSNILKLQILLFLSIVAVSNADEKVNQPDPECIEWLKDGKVQSGTKGCEVECSTLMIDMRTFQCLGQCDILCGIVAEKINMGKVIYYPGLTPSEKN